MHGKNQIYSDKEDHLKTHQQNSKLRVGPLSNLGHLITEPYGASLLLPVLVIFFPIKIIKKAKNQALNSLFLFHLEQKRENKKKNSIN